MVKDMYDHRGERNLDIEKNRSKGRFDIPQMAKTILKSYKINHF